MPTKKKQPAKKTVRKRAATRPAVTGPVTLEQARAIVAAESAPPRGRRRAPGIAHVVAAEGIGPSPVHVGEEQQKLEREMDQERERRIRDYAAVMRVLEQRGAAGVEAAASSGRRRGPIAAAPRAPLLRILAEGDSWFEYPVPLFGGGVIPRLAKLLDVEILNLAKAGDEVRFMMGVKERAILADQLHNGSPAGGPWDVLLFSGGGNDIVDNPMTLWLKDFDPAIPPAGHLQQARFDAALALVRAGYEDLIALRDRVSPATHLIFHGYDYPLPDGRGVCTFGPWLRPAFDSRKFPRGSSESHEVVKEMLRQFAAMLKLLESKHVGSVSVLDTQSTLEPVKSSWHNELHPSRQGFNRIAQVFHAKLKELFPGRVAG